MKTKLNTLFTDKSTEAMFSFLPMLNIVADIAEADVVIVPNIAELQKVHTEGAECQFILTDCSADKAEVAKFRNTMQYPDRPTFLLPQLGTIYNQRKADGVLKGAAVAAAQ